MQELDQPVKESGVEECGMMPPTSSPSMTTPPTPPSLSINLNAQGMDNIEQIMQLVAKVNPDAAPKDGGLPSLSMAPAITSITPSSLPALPNLDSDDSDSMDGPDDSDDVSKMQGDLDNDGDHDMDDHDMEKKDKDEAFGNSVANSEPEVKDLDSSIPDGNDLNRPKKTFPKVAGGDNPMQRMESTDLRSQIRAELQRRLNEAKGAK